MHLQEGALQPELQAVGQEGQPRAMPDLSGRSFTCWEAFASKQTDTTGLHTCVQSCGVRLIWCKGLATRKRAARQVWLLFVCNPIMPCCRPLCAASGPSLPTHRLSTNDQTAYVRLMPCIVERSMQLMSQLELLCIVKLDLELVARRPRFQTWGQRGQSETRSASCQVRQLSAAVSSCHLAASWRI